MNYTLRPAVFVLVAIALLGLLPNRAKAEDWPQFGRDSARNAVSPERNAPTAWDVGQQDDAKPPHRIKKTQRNILWSSRLGTMTYGDPVVVNGMVWVGTNNGFEIAGKDQLDASVLTCFRESDGELLYSYVSPRLPQGRVHDWPQASMACSPLVENDRLWFVSNRAEVVCLDVGGLRRDGSEPKTLWKVDLIGEHGVFPRGSIMNVSRLCSITAYKDNIYVITGTGVDEGGAKVPNPDAPSLICFDKQTGKAIWKDNSPGANLLIGQWSSPTIVEIDHRAQCVVSQGDGWVRSFDALSGKPIWQFDMNGKQSRWGAGKTNGRGDVLASPVFAGNRIYVASGLHPTWDVGRPGRLVCLDPTKQGDISSELAVDAKSNVVAQRRIQAVDAAQGEKAIPNPNSGLVWEFKRLTDNPNYFNELMHDTVSNIVVHGSLAIAVDFAGMLHCLDATSGKHHWSHDLNAGCYGSPLIVDDKIYVGTEDGRIVILGLSADPRKALREVASGLDPLFEIEMGSTVFCSPIFANGVLYVATMNELFAIAALASGSEAKESRNAPGKEGARPAAFADKARERVSSAVFVPTPQDIVEQMLELANPKETDVVCDLGSGDGRIVVTAAKKYGCRAVGYERDKELVALSHAKAKAAGVESRVSFETSDLFAAELKDVDVITLYLLPQQLEKLLPRLAKLKAGVRIVSHHFAIPGTPPDKIVKAESKEDGAEHTIYLWTTPLQKITE
ncbi:MAG TPA: PQQ-binding-like beta-propeller repeat protein [Pirellulales bacterium]|jgi:outer membrane protein assembly factor BamB/precorrin-6B methylase 2